MILAAELQGFLDRSWNSKRTLVFAHVLLTKTLGVRRDQELQAWITWQMDLWERGMHAGLLGDDEAEGAAREVRATSGGKEEGNAVAQSYHDKVLSSNLR